MHRHHQRLHHHGQYAEADSAPLEPIVIPEVPGIVKRAPMPTSESGSTERCEPGDDSARCEKNTSTTNNTVLPVVLGAVYVLPTSYPLYLDLPRPLCLIGIQYPNCLCDYSVVLSASAKPKETPKRRCQ